MKAYKVVSYDNGKFLSCGSGLQEDHALCLEYKVGEITIAWKGTVGIFIFKSINEAFTYKFYKSCSRILEVDTLSPILPITKLSFTLSILESDVFHLSSYKDTLIDIEDVQYYVPSSTYLCNKIKVIKQL